MTNPDELLIVNIKIVIDQYKKKTQKLPRDTINSEIKFGYLFL